MILIEVGVDFFKIVINSRHVFSRCLQAMQIWIIHVTKTEFSFNSFLGLQQVRSDLLFGLEPFFFAGVQK